MAMSPRGISRASPTTSVGNKVSAMSSGNAISGGSAIGLVAPPPGCRPVSA
jgi:hypothetical protein